MHTSSCRCQLCTESLEVALERPEIHFLFQVMPDNEFIEFWYPALQHGVHVWKIESVISTGNARHVMDAGAYLENHADIAHLIGQQGKAFVREALSPPIVELYWVHLLQTYAKYQVFKPISIHPQAIPVGSSLLSDHFLAFGDRMCETCPHVYNP